MANEFNNYFINVASGITKKIPRTPKSPLDKLRILKTNVRNLLINRHFIGASAAVE